MAKQSWLLTYVRGSRNSKTMRKPIPFAILVLLGIVFDLLTKNLAFSALSPTTTYVLIPNVLEFVNAKNFGVAFSLLAGFPWFILVVTSGAIVFLIWLYTRIRETAHGLLIAAIALLLIGATGNLIDRLFLGYVRDFIDFTPRLPLIGHWAVFNVADIGITVGVILFVIAEFFFAPAPEKKTPDEPNQSAENMPSA